MLLGYWVIGLLGYWVIELLGYWNRKLIDDRINFYVDDFKKHGIQIIS